MDRVKKGTTTSILLGLGVTIAVGWIAALISEPLIRLFSDEQPVIDYGVQSLRIRCIYVFSICVYRRAGRRYTRKRQRGSAHDYFYG